MSRHVQLIEFDSPLVTLESPRWDTAGAAADSKGAIAATTTASVPKSASKPSSRRQSTGAPISQLKITQNEQNSTHRFEYDWPLCAKSTFSFSLLDH
jgi:hypothetical protein